MLSFADFWEELDARKSPLMGSGEESQAEQLIRAGDQLRGDDDSSFWDDFTSLLSNQEGWADLLGVSSDKILGWSSRIHELRDKTKNDTVNKPSDDEEKEVLPTGDNGAITTNQDPMLGDLSK